MKITRKVGITAAAAAVLSLAGFGIAYASIPDSGGVIHGCYKTAAPAKGALGVIDSATETCPAGTTSLNWSQVGPQGPAGPSGTTGPQGLAGPSTGGSSGLDLETVVSQAPLYQAATATCPPDHPFLFGGGGGDEASPRDGLAGFPGGVSSTGPETGTQSWVVPAISQAPGGRVTAYAICGK